MIQNAHIFITGGGVFIGSTLTDQFIEHNQITIYDNFHRNALKDKPFINHKNINIIEGDVLNYEHLSKAMKGANYVIHAAAIAGIDTVIKSPTRTLSVNMIGTANTLKAASELPHLKRFIDFSTSEVFGSQAFNSKESDITEIGTAGEARWVYAVSKLSGEHLTHAYYNEFNMPNVTVRPFNVYGPGQVGESAMHKFIEQAIQDKEIEIYGDGSQIRAWCYIDDFIEGITCCIENPKAIGESLNIGNSRAVVTIFGLAQTICRILDSKSQIIFKPALSADVELRIPSIIKAQELLGFTAKTELDEGIKRTAAWFRKQI